MLKIYAANTVNSWHLTIRSSRPCFTAANFSGMFVLYCRRAAGRLNSGVRLGWCSKTCRVKSRIILHGHCFCTRPSASPRQAPVPLARPVPRTRRPACRSVQARSTRLHCTPCFRLAQSALWRLGTPMRQPCLRRTSCSRPAPSKHCGSGFRQTVVQQYTGQSAPNSSFKPNPLHGGKFFRYVRALLPPCSGSA